MATIEAFDSKGSKVALGNEIARGGEGVVYDVIGHADSVAKIYLNPLRPMHRAKLAAMTSMADPSLLGFTAWPTAMLHNRSGAATGFVMPKFKGHSPVFKLYGPKLRMQEFPKADWGFLIHAAANTARAFAAIHKAGFVIGDVNHGNMMVGQDATIRLIDCDSFQVSKDGQTWFCQVGIDTHQPPEMQGLPSYDGVIRTPNHDNFGLAVFMFQLLCMGRHPFAGRFLGAGDPPAIPEAIARFQYAYAQDQKRTRMAPAAGSLPVDALTPQLRNLFEMAFCPDSSRGRRPSGEEWIRALLQLGASLRECAQNRAHRYIADRSRCPWCEIETASGVPLFPIVFLRSSGSGTSIAALWQEVVQVAAPPSLPPFPDHQATKVVPSAGALRAARGERRLKIAAYCMLCFGWLSAIAAAPSDKGLLFSAVFGGIVAAIFRFKGKSLLSPQRQRLGALEADLAILKRAWNAPSGALQFGDVRLMLFSKKAAYDGLPAQRAMKLQQLSEQVRQKQMEAYLDRCPIASARIPGVGPAKAAMLASHGIDTAGDIDYSKVLLVPGFGKVTTNKLVEWRRSQERTFRFDPQRGVPQSALDNTERDIATSRNMLEREITAGLGQLKAIAAAESRHRQALMQRADELFQAYSEAASEVSGYSGNESLYKRLLYFGGTTAALATLISLVDKPLMTGGPAQDVSSIPTPQTPTVVYRAPLQQPLAPNETFILPPIQPAVPPPSASTQVPVSGPAGASDLMPDASGTSPPTTTVATAMAGKVLVRITANVRDLPNGRTIVRTVPQGASLKVFSKRDGWVQIGDDAPWGWVYSGLLSDLP